MSSDMSDKLSKANSSETFCVMPWIHQYIAPTGEVRPCCAYTLEYKLGSMKTDSLNDIWNNEATKQLRLDMLNGVSRIECERCNVRDNLLSSFKLDFNNRFFKVDEIKEVVANTLDDGTVEDHKLYFIDVRFNNLCNFKCRTCGPHFSTSLVMEHRKVHAKSANVVMDNGFQYPGKTEEDALEQIKPHIPTAYELYFAGGEPLMQEDHYKVLDELFIQNKQHIKVYYNTNFSSLKLGKWNVLEYWKKMNTVSVSASIDGMGTKAEYWRKNTVWSDIELNIHQLKKECPNVNFMVNSTVSWPNVNSVLEMHKSLVERKMLAVNNINVNLLDGPIYYSLKTVPLWKKQSITVSINEHIEWLKTINAPAHTIAKFKNIIDFMMSEHVEMDIRTFHRVTSRFDSLRDEQFFEVFPEHNDMLKYMTEQGYVFERGLFPSYDWGNK